MWKPVDEGEAAPASMPGSSVVCSGLFVLLDNPKGYKRKGDFASHFIGRKMRGQGPTAEKWIRGGSSNHGYTDGLYWMGKLLPASVGRSEWAFDLGDTSLQLCCIG